MNKYFKAIQKIKLLKIIRVGFRLLKLFFKVIKAPYNFIKKTYNFLCFLFQCIRFGSFLNPIKEKHIGTVAVLANGPSLKEDLPRILFNKESTTIDYMVLNDFAFDDVFYKIKPIHYCLADPGYFNEGSENNKEDTVRAKKLLFFLQNKVDWDLKLYIPKTAYHDFLIFSGITNKKISIVKMNCLHYSGYPSLQNYFYKRGMAMPRVQTVANMAIYIALNSGYREVRLYGFDHTFFDFLKVNESNQLCYIQNHFYDNNKVWEPIFDINGNVLKTSEYITAISYMFKSHDILAAYAKYLKVKIINCTKCSLIDSYEREN